MTVFFICPKSDTPSGGVLFLHKMASLLDRAGVKSRVIQKPSFGWPDFDGSPPDNWSTVLAGDNEQITSADTVIVPEVLWPLAGDEGRRILCVQNYIWLPEAITILKQKPETIVCSRYLANHMERVYGIKPIGKVTPFLDEGVWQVTPKESNHVLVIARRNDHWKKMVVALEAGGFPYTVIDRPMNQRDLAEAFGKCEYYVHLVYPEGFPAICMEAMASGTVVVGTTGGGGNELMHNNETALTIQDPPTGRYTEDVFIGGIMGGLNWLRDNPDGRRRIQQTAFDWVKRYNAEATTRELLGVFGNARPLR